FGKRIDDVVGAEDEGNVGVAEVAVDVFHLEDLVVGDLGFREQHVHVAWYASRDGVNRVADVHALLDQLVRHLLGGVLRPSNGEYITGDDDDVVRVAEQERDVL